ncbi:MAG: helix-turn-helix transcriptional regulator [Lachnospiraceae bacterium]|nr:helix-turn-helix transcriptional regulator [Lachnospiraceae bacterium]
MQQYSLKELRARKNLTQSEVAEIMGISVQTYNAWEKDVSNVAIGKVNALAEFFGVTVGEIFLPCNMKNIHI